MVSDFRGLVVWQRARETTVAVYRLTERFPPSERWGLTAQMRRAAVSIAANIAEGNGRRYRREYSQFLSIALGSLRELQSHILVARDIGFGDPDACDGTFALAEEGSTHAAGDAPGAAAPRGVHRSAPASLALSFPRSLVPSFPRSLSSGAP